MQRKQILMLSILAVGITIELILMAAYVGSRGNSKMALLSTISVAEAGGNQQNGRIDTGETAPGAQETPLYGDDAPITDDDMFGSSEPNFGDEPTPVFDFGDGALAEGLTYSDGLGGTGYGLYPAPDADPYDDNGYYPDIESYPAPPTLGPAPYDPMPTDVGAATLPAPTAAAQTPTRTVQAPTATRTLAAPTQPAPRPTATQPGAPTARPTATAPAPQQPTPTLPQPTLAGVSGNTLLSVRGDAPQLDGSAGDEVWKNAPSLRIDTSGGANDSSAQVTARSVYDSENIYFLFTWDDPTQSFLRLPWEKQQDGSWKQLSTPGRVLNDENSFAEDMLAVMWSMRGMPGFTTRGCGEACHSGENSDVKPLGNMRAPEGGRGDLWQWKSVRGSGQVDDLLLDDDTFSSENLFAGLKQDPNDGGGYRTNRNDDRTAPAFMAPGGPNDGSPGYISEGEKASFDDSQFRAGDRVPSVLTEPFRGDRGDISASWRYRSGRWTLEIRRRLVTGSNYDVQFSDLNAAYPFALATFDNTEIRHAAQEGSAELRFRP